MFQHSSTSSDPSLPALTDPADSSDPSGLIGLGSGTGVVIRADRGAAVVACGGPDGPLVQMTFGPALRRLARAGLSDDPDDRSAGLSGAVGTGDRITWAAGPGGQATIESVEPRRAQLTRASASGTSVRQLLAANMDVVGVVEGLMPDPDLRRLSRLLALAWASGAEPVIILTKADLVPDADQFASEVAMANACPVITVSAVDQRGVDEVAQLLVGGRTLVLLGASGAGKSSLVNALAGGELMRTQSLRHDGKGRHTTVTRELHRVGAGWVIDGPGLRGVGLDGSDGLDMAFADVEDLAGQCRFRDCGHDSEPGCAVAGAVDAGQLDPDRLDSWRQLQAEGRRQEIRRDNRLRAEQNRQLRVWGRAMRQQRIFRP